MSFFKSASVTRTGRAALVVSLTGAVLVAAAGTSFAAATTSTLSAYTGPSGGLNTITITSPTAKFYAGAAVNFQYSTTTAAPTSTTCTATYQQNAALTGASTSAITGNIVVTNPKVLSSTKIAVTIPAGLAIPAAAVTAGVPSINFTVCVYSGSSFTSTSVGSPVVTFSDKKYAIAAAPQVTGISPAGGPALGGGTVTITGSNFITGMTATLGGKALANPTVVNSTTFTGTVPANAAGTANLSVNTTGGAASLTNAFTYSDGLIVDPKTTPSATAATDLDISGVGFTSKDFSTTTGTTQNNNKAHVYLVDGAYDATDDGNGEKTNAQLAECTDVLVISDVELICTVNTQTSAQATRSINTVTLSDSAHTITGTAGDFKYSDVGAAVTSAADITAGTIVSVSADGSVATVGNSDIASNPTDVAVTVKRHVAPTRSFADGTTTNGSATLTSTAAAAFSTSDIGAPVYGVGIPAGTTIIARASATSVTLSANATVTSTAGAAAVTVGGAPLANGTYTVTVVGNGTVGSSTPPSIISSGSTFTVAPY